MMGLPSDKWLPLLLGQLGRWLWLPRVALGSVVLLIYGVVLATSLWLRCCAAESSSSFPCKSTLSFYSLLLGATALSGLVATRCDPGVVSAMEPPLTVEKPRSCSYCEGNHWKPSRASHCRVCDHCVFMRHSHCVILGRCIGWRNRKLVLLLTLYLSCFLLMSLASLLLDWRELSLAAWFERPLALCRSVVISLLTSLLLLFSLYTLKAHVESLLSNQLPLEELRQIFGQPVEGPWALWTSLRQVFGPRLWTWPLPLPNSAVPDYADKVYWHHPFTGEVAEVPSDELETFMDTKFYRRAAKKGGKRAAPRGNA